MYTPQESDPVDFEVSSWERRLSSIVVSLNKALIGALFLWGGGVGGGPS